MINACIFDLDGVIVDTADYHFKAWKRLADHLEIDFTEDENEKMKGISRMASLKKLISLGDREFSDRDMQKFYVTKNTWYLESIAEMDATEILPGVIDLLDDLSSRNIKIGLGSASRNARKVLSLTGLTDRFEAIVDGNEVTNSKPDPEVFLKGAKLLGVEPSNTIVFEDSAKGVDAAIAGGFRSIGIGRPENLGHADIVVPTFEGFDYSSIVERLEALLATA